jgi:predicted RNA-binding Zn ribbon-like protein
MSRIASRSPAPLRATGRLSRSDLLWVANTAHGPGGHWHARARDGEPDHDHIATAADALRYLVDHRVPTPPEPPDAAALASLAAIRSSVERLLAAGNSSWSEPVSGLMGDAVFALGPDGRLESLAVGWAGFCEDLLVPLASMAVDGVTLHRCANRHCRLIFEDGSRSHTRRWCDSAACGNRERVGRARRGEAD